ncbi:unnamed protein product, partial [Citrullus colocynthis]
YGTVTCLGAATTLFPERTKLLRYPGNSTALKRPDALKTGRKRICNNTAALSQ